MRKYDVGIDTSLSKFAMVIKDRTTGEVITHKLYRTGGVNNKKKYNFVSYFDRTEDQIEYIVDSVSSQINLIKDEINSVSIEGLSFSSVGNATRDLAGVYFTLLYVLKKMGIKGDRVNIYSPQRLKKVAKDILLEDGFCPDKLKDLKGKDYALLAAELLYPDVVKDYKMSPTSVNAGKDDISDALMAIEATERS